LQSGDLDGELSGILPRGRSPLAVIASAARQSRACME
jgi:hypothetical protein